MRVAAVVNPTKVAGGIPGVPAARALLRGLLATHGAALEWYETTVEDPGAGQARAAVASGADLVLAWGGDGTVRSVLTGVADQPGAAGTARVPLGVLPGGTGNLLARNLGIPLGLEPAVTVAVTGRTRTLDAFDVGLGGRTTVGTVIAGMGLDAVLVTADEDLKRRVGYVAYGLNTLRAMRHPRMHVAVSVDGSRPTWYHARSVMVANVGGLMGGLDVAPEAKPDDGWLDVVVLPLSSPRDWAVTLQSLVRRLPAGTEGRIHLRARRVMVVARGEWQRQVDGDDVGTGSRLEARVRPAAVDVRVP